jgi:hypothetical protein
MAGTSGPTKTLPGSLHPVPPGAMCDKHPDRIAIARVQGETDSMAAELIDCCAFCAPVVQAAAKSAAVDCECDRCHEFSDQLKNYRDPDEGAAGRLYQLCERCIADARDSDQASTGIAPELSDEHDDENALEVDTDPDNEEFGPGEQPTDFADLDHIGDYDPVPRRRI